MRMCSRKYRNWRNRKPVQEIKSEANSKEKSSQANRQCDKPKEGSTCNYTIAMLHSIINLPHGWYDHTSPDLDSIRLCKITDTASSSSQPLVITHLIIVKPDLSWQLFIHNREVRKCSALSSIQPQLNETAILELISLVDKVHICAGHPESKFVTFVESRKGKLFGKSGDVSAFVDHYAPVKVNGEIFQKTVRTSGCEMLVHGEKCNFCSSYPRT